MFVFVQAYVHVDSTRSYKNTTHHEVSRHHTTESEESNVHVHCTCTLFDLVFKALYVSIHKVTFGCMYSTCTCTCSKHNVHLLKYTCNCLENCFVLHYPGTGIYSVKLHVYMYYYYTCMKYTRTSTHVHVKAALGYVCIALC